MKIINKTRLLAIRDTKILVLENVGKPIRLTLAGGVAKKKETLEESLKRETAEEIGLKINLTDLAFFYSSPKVIDDKIIVKHFYVSLHVSDLFKVIEKEKFKAVYWIEWQDAIRYMDKQDKKAVKEYFKKNSANI